MIKVFGLDPKLLSGWKDFRYVDDQFGIAKGRLISRYPKNWKTLVYRSLSDCSDVEKKRIEEKLRQIIDNKLLPRQHDCYWSSTKTWLSNAEEEHRQRAFDAIIAGSNPGANAAVLCYDELDEALPQWKATTQIDVERQAEPMAASVTVLLQNCREIAFIDPNFSPTLRRYGLTLEAFLDTAARAKKPPGRIEYHIADNKNKWDPASLARSSRDNLPRFIPKEMEVLLYVWKQKPEGEKLHDRFILTDGGGVAFSVGLDTGHPGEKTMVTLLSNDSWELTCKKYRSDTPAFDLIIPPISIRGCR